MCAFQCIALTVLAKNSVQRGECVIDELFSYSYRDPIDTSFSLGMECSELKNSKLPHSLSPVAAGL